ncbi:histone deacetylase [Malassezia yamatoensis]|uniref:histone deacetylase n=1 Tax=Malassezia yamatoensis TaxID=253288 RepID=A0AAJ5YU75_9BASI|nr:histone deacetylase [Malassezia yamatoensis]
MQWLGEEAQRQDTGLVDNVELLEAGQLSEPVVNGVSPDSVQSMLPIAIADETPQRRLVEESVSDTLPVDIVMQSDPALSTTPYPGSSITQIEPESGVPMPLESSPTPPPPTGTGLVYDARMMLHASPALGDTHPERPERIERIYSLLERKGCVARMIRIPAREALRREVALVHEPSLWDEFEVTVRMPIDQLREYSRQLEQRASLYLNEHSTISARFACGSVIEMCHAVASRRFRNGFALVRPPGHHAEPGCGTGFCLYNNVAVAASSVLANHQGEDRVRRIMIVDWDVHHGNGTQRAFWNNPDVLYVSLHRYENASFYPGTTYGNYDMVGGPAALGKSLNIPWPCGGMGDADYLHAFQQCILPVAYEFAPDMVIISAGFDAAEGDLLGGCHVSPPGYAHLTHQLAALANGRLVVALEGGYNLDAISESALGVTRVLLGDAPPALLSGIASSTAGVDTVKRAVRAQAPYWHSLAVAEPQLPPDGQNWLLHEALAAKRTLSLWEQHRMAPLPAIPHMQIDPNQVSCSASLMKSCDTLLIFVHDYGSIQNSESSSDDKSACDAKMQLSDSSELLAQFAAQHGWASADMSTSSPLPVRSIRNQDRERLVPSRTEVEAAKQLAAQVIYLWDNFFALSPAKHIVLVAQGTAVDSIMHLIARRVVQNRVIAIIQFMGYNPIPLIPKQRQELKAWYYRHSLVVCPFEHPLYMWGEQSASGKRLGHTIRALDSDAANLIAASWSEVEAFLKFRIRNARAAVK